MNKIFIFTAADSEARSNLELSIRNQIPESLVFDCFEPKFHHSLQAIKNNGEGFFAWGATPAEGGKKDKNRYTWNNMNSGDWILCVYESTYHFASTVLEKYINPKFAESLWGKKYTDGRRENPTWEYMYFLTKPTKINVKLQEVNNWLSKSYWGFTGIGVEKLKLIENEFGAVDNFMRQKILKTAPPSYLPTFEDFIQAYKMIADLGKSVPLDKILEVIERNISTEGKVLKSNWKNITERNIKEHWTSGT